VTYACTKESNGFLSESYAFIPIVIAATPAGFMCGGVCLWQLKKGDVEEECIGPSIGLLVYFYFGWLFAFLAVKSDFYADFNWGVGLVPFWLIFAAVLIGIGGGAIAMLCGSSHSEKIIFLQFTIFFVPGYLGMVAWFVLLSINLEAQDLDEPLIPWILVDTPLFVSELAFTMGVGYLLEKIRNN